MDRRAYAGIGLAMLALMYVAYLALGSSNTWALYAAWTLLSLAMLAAAWAYTGGLTRA